MRILITSIVDLRRVAHNRVHVFAEYLSRAHDVTVLCLNAWWLDKLDRAETTANYHDDPYFQQLFERTRILYLSDGRQPPVLQELASLRTLDALLQKIDLASFDVHVNYGNLIAGYAVARKARSFGIPTVLDIADDLPHSFARSPQVPRILRPAAQVVARQMLAANTRLASRVTFVTEALKEAYRLPEDKAVLLPNGFHQEFVALESSQALRQELGLGQAFVLGFVGTMLEWVDLEPAFVALRDLSADGNDVRMLVVGGGAKLLEYTRLADRHAISDRVVFTDQVPLGRVPRYVSCMDVCLVCRRDTTDSDRSLPVKLFEYMASGKPVVSMFLSGVREAVGDRVLYAKDGVELTSRINQLYVDAGLRQRMGLEGRKFVQENYDWESICRRFEAILTEAASENSGAASMSGLPSGGDL